MNNQTFMSGLVGEHLHAYETELIQSVRRIDSEGFRAMIDILLDAYHARRNVFIVGNGGSAATANHFVCDFGKNAVQGDKRRFRILSLCDNIEKITALGNDIAFDDIFRQQLINLMDEGDVVIFVSASGNSPDLIRAAEYAREHGAKLISLTGFSGGKLKTLSDVCLVAQMDSYERIEDLHLMILHMVVSFFKAHQELLRH